MLKHASNNSNNNAGTVVLTTAVVANGTSNGQQRVNNTENLPPATTAVSATTATSTASAARNIHLRPQQPLNISTLSSNLQSAGGGGGAAVNTAINGSRIPLPLPVTLLNIVSPPVNGFSGGTATSTTPITPLTPNGGIGNSLLHHHTYTNQQVLPANNNNHISNNQQQQPSFNNLTAASGLLYNQSKHGPGPREALTSLGLLCLVSLLLALLSLIFLLKISPNAREDAALITRTTTSTDDFVIVYDVTVALCALSLSLNLCCLLVCAIQFLFAVKLVRSPMFDGRDNKYLEKSGVSRVCAVGGFFISIPIFLTGIILYTFNNFPSTPAIITSVLIGIGIVFCGGAMVHNVFVWQKEKTISYRSPNMHQYNNISHIGPIMPPIQFLSHASYHQQEPASNTLQTQLHQSHLRQQPHNFMFNHLQPVSPNHSHESFNHVPYLLRSATATPPTPKPPPHLTNGCLPATLFGGNVVPREASGSVSPGLPGTLDMSNITSPSLHELSTLV